MVDGFKMDLRMDLNSKALITLTNKECDRAAKKAVEKIKKESKKYLANETENHHGEKGLAGRIKLEPSKYEGGGWALEAQGPGNYTRYYAIFVELGHRSSMFGKYSRKKGNIGSSPVEIAPVPYLRTPLKRNRTHIKNLFKDLI